MREGAQNQAPQPEKAHSPEDKKRFDLIAQKDSAEQFLKDNAEKLAQNREAFEAIDDSNPNKDIARQMIQDLEKETAKRQAAFDAATAELTSMANAEIAAMNGTITGDSMEDALQKAADKYGVEPEMELENPLDTASRLGDAHQARQERIKAMGERVDARMKAEDDLEKMVMEPVEGESRQAELERQFEAARKELREFNERSFKADEEFRGKLAKLEGESAELLSDMQGVNEDMKKAVEAKSFDAARVYASASNELHQKLQAKLAESKNTLDEYTAVGNTNNEQQTGLVDKLVAAKTALDAEQHVGTDKLLEMFEGMSAEERMALTPEQLLAMAERADGEEVEDSMIESSEPTEVIVDASMIEESKDLTSEEKTEAKDLIVKNELPPKQKEALMKEGQELATQVEQLQKELFKGDKGIDNQPVPGLEGKLKDFGIDPEKMVVSRWERFKTGIKTLINADARRTMRQYESKMSEWSEKSTELNDIQSMLENPKAHIARKQRSLIKLMGMRARMSRPSKPAGGLFSFRG